MRLASSFHSCHPFSPALCVLLSSLENKLFSPGFPLGVESGWPGRCGGQERALGSAGVPRGIPLARPRLPRLLWKQVRPSRRTGTVLQTGLASPTSLQCVVLSKLTPKTGTERAQRRPLGRRSWARGVCGALKIPVLVRKVPAAAAVPVASRARRELRYQRLSSRQSNRDAVGWKTTRLQLFFCYSVCIPSVWAVLTDNDTGLSFLFAVVQNTEALLALKKKINFPLKM